MGKRPEFVWIGRERCPRRDDWYCVSPFQECRMERISQGYGVEFGGDSQNIWLCPKAVHRVLGIKLKPGEGPVRVKFTAELVRD